MGELEIALGAIEAALQDAEASLSTDLGGQREVTALRLWRGQVLVDWEPDEQVGDCLLRPALLRQLAADHSTITNVTRGHHAPVTSVTPAIELRAPGRVVAALSPEHAALVKRLGGARRVALTIRLHVGSDGAYLGGEERFALVDRGKHLSLLTLKVEVRLRTALAASPRTSPAPS